MRSLPSYLSAFCSLFFSALSALSAVNPSAAAEPTYWQDIRPVLRKNCTACHAARNLAEREVSGGLALDTYDSARKHADAKFLKLLVITDENKRMPLGAPPLPEETVALLRRWIETGAKEGKKPDGRSSSGTIATPGRRRKLDVVFGTSAVPPKGAFGPMNPAKLELTLKVGPLSPVAAVAFSPDGKLLASGSYGLVTVWDLTTGRPVRVLTAVLGAVNDLRFSPDGKLLAVAGGQPSAKGDLRLFQVSDWKLLASLPGHADVVSSVAFSPDGKRLASASFDKTVRIWDVPAGRVGGVSPPVRTLTGHSDFVYAVAFSPDGKWLASASKDRSVKLVEAATGKSVFSYSGMDQDVMAVAFSPDGKHVVSSGFEPGLFWWDTKTGARERVQGGHGIAVHEVCFSKDGKLVASAGADRTARLWNGTTGAPVKALAVGSSVYAVALSPDGKRLAAGSFDGLVRLYDVASGRLLASLLSLSEGWLALTPEGYAAGSAEVTKLGQWRMAGKGVAGEAVWKALGQPETVAKALRGEALAAPNFK